MTEQGRAVIEQSRDNSWLNTEPAVVKGAVVGVIGAVGSILVIGGWVEPAEVEVIKDNAGVIVPAAFAVIAVLQAVWTRVSTYSPRTAAKIAVENAARAGGSPPTLAPPP